MKRIISVALILMMCFSIINASAISVENPEKISYAILNFDKSEIPNAAEKIHLNFFVSTQYGLEGLVYGKSSVDVDNVNFDKFDLSDATLIGEFLANSTSGEAQVDVTSFVNSKAENISFIIAPKDKTQTDMKVFSKNSSDKKPYLSVTGSSLGEDAIIYKPDYNSSFTLDDGKNGTNTAEVRVYSNYPYAFNSGGNNGASAIYSDTSNSSDADGKCLKVELSPYQLQYGGTTKIYNAFSNDALTNNDIGTYNISGKIKLGTAYNANSSDGSYPLVTEESVTISVMINTGKTSTGATSLGNSVKVNMNTSDWTEFNFDYNLTSENVTEQLGTLAFTTSKIGSKSDEERSYYYIDELKVVRKASEKTYAPNYTDNYTYDASATTYYNSTLYSFNKGGNNGCDAITVSNDTSSDADGKSLKFQTSEYQLSGIGRTRLYNVFGNDVLTETDKGTYKISGKIKLGKAYNASKSYADLTEETIGIYVTKTSGSDYAGEFKKITVNSTGWTPFEINYNLTDTNINNSYGMLTFTTDKIGSKSKTDRSYYYIDELKVEKTGKFTSYKPDYNSNFTVDNASSAIVYSANHNAYKTGGTNGCTVSIDTANSSDGDAKCLKLTTPTWTTSKGDGRTRFYNIFGNDALTSTDKGTYVISGKAKLGRSITGNTEEDLTIQIMGNAGTYASSALGDTTKITMNTQNWTPFTLVYNLTDDNVNGQVGVLGFITRNLYTNESKEQSYYYIDELNVEKVISNFDYSLNSSVNANSYVEAGTENIINDEGTLNVVYAPSTSENKSNILSHILLFADKDGNRTYNVSDSAKIDKIEVTNYTGEDALVICAVYNGNTMVSAKPVKVNANGLYSVNLPLGTVTENTDVKTIAISGAGVPLTFNSLFNIKKSNGATLYTVGDSIMDTYSPDDEGTKENYNKGFRGWTQMWGEDGIFDESLTLNNSFAEGGRSTKSWMHAYYAYFLNKLKPGDFVIISFGHNDETNYRYGNYKVGVNTQEYYNNLKDMAQSIKDKGAYPIFATSIARLELERASVLVPYVETMKKAANDFNIPLIDLQKATLDKITKEGESACAKYYVADRVHLSEEGARWVYNIALDQIKELDIPLEKYITS